MKRETIHAVRTPSGGIQISAGPYLVDVADAKDLNALKAASETLMELASGFSRSDVLLAAYAAK